MPKRWLTLDPVTYETGYDDALRDCIREIKIIELDHPQHKEILALARARLINLVDCDIREKK